MLKKEVTYEDFNGDSVTETLYFNISKSEVVEMQVGGIAELLSKVTAAGAKGDDIIATFKRIIGMAYGTKSDDGRRFHKDPEQTADFLSSPAYDAVFMELVTGDATTMLKFIQGILPADLVTDDALASAAAQAGLKVDIPVSTPPATTQGITVNAIKLAEPAASVAPVVDPAVPAPFRGKGSAGEQARSRPHGHSGDPRKRNEAAAAEPEPTEPKPLNQMSEDELRAELAKLRSN